MFVGEKVDPLSSSSPRIDTVLDWIGCLRKLTQGLTLFERRNHKAKIENRLLKVVFVNVFELLLFFEPFAWDHFAMEL